MQTNWLKKVNFVLALAVMLCAFGVRYNQTQNVSELTMQNTFAENRQEAKANAFVAETLLGVEVPLMAAAEVEDEIGEANILFEYGGNSIEFSIESEGETKINWGDGNIQSVKPGKVSHKYSDTLGTHKVQIEDKVYFLNISGVKGVKNLSLNSSELEFLDCANTEISELDLSKCENLKYLVCNNTNISELNLTACEELEYLYYGEGIKSIKLNEKCKTGLKLSGSSKTVIEYVKAESKPEETYGVDIIAEGASVKGDGKYYPGETVEVVLTTKPGYEFLRLQRTSNIGVDKIKQSQNGEQRVLTFTMPEKDIEIELLYEKVDSIPTIVNITPDDGSENVGGSFTVRIDFSEAMDIADGIWQYLDIVDENGEALALPKSIYPVSGRYFEAKYSNVEYRKCTVKLSKAIKSLAGIELDKNYEFTFYKTSEEPVKEEQSEGKRLSDIVKLGDYVEYIPSETSYSVAKQTYNPSLTTSWRVLTNDETNKLQIIPEGIVSGEALKISGKSGYDNLVQTLNNFSAAYVNEEYAVSGRSVGTTAESVAVRTGSLSYRMSEKNNVRDNLYTVDLELMEKAGVKVAENSYWLGSRDYIQSVPKDGRTIFFGRSILAEGELTSGTVTKCQYRIGWDKSTASSFDEHGVRPVITLKDNLVVVGGKGTKEEPYEIGTADSLPSEGQDPEHLPCSVTIKLEEAGLKFADGTTEKIVEGSQGEKVVIPEIKDEIDEELVIYILDGSGEIVDTLKEKVEVSYKKNNELIKASELKFEKESYELSAYVVAWIELPETLPGKEICKTMYYRDNKIYEGGISIPVEESYLSYDAYIMLDGQCQKYYIDESSYPVDIYIITYDANGGLVNPEAQTKKAGEAIILAGLIEREGYNFLGWSVEQNAETPELLAGAIYKADMNVTLYAVWEMKEDMEIEEILPEEIIYTISYNSNGGLVNPASQTKKVGETIVLAGPIEREGYNFLGWTSNAAIGNVEYLATAEYETDANVILYAVWESIIEEPVKIRDFIDVEEDAWYYDIVTTTDYLEGTTSMTFSPDDPLTREMFIAALYNVAGNPSVSGSSNFPDVYEGSWSEDAIVWATENGLVKGYEDGRFKPSENVTRQEAIVVLKKYAEYVGISTDKRSDLTNFEDAKEVYDWAVEAMSWAVAEEIISGNNNNELSATQDLTRAQMVSIFNNLLKVLN